MRWIESLDRHRTSRLAKADHVGGRWRRGWLLVLVAGVVLAIACSRSEKPLAMIGDEPLTPAQFVEDMRWLLEEGQSVQDLGLTPEAALRRVVRMRLLLRAAERSAPALSASDAGRLTRYQEMLFRDALLDERYPDPPVFEEAEVRRRYESRPARERRVEFLVSGDPGLLLAARQSLIAGESFSAVADRLRQAHPDSIGAQSAGYVIPGQLPPILEAAIWSLPPGGTSEPMASQDGLVLVHVPEEREAPYERLRAAIVKELESEVRATRTASFETEILAAGEFRTDSASVNLVIRRVSAHRDSLRRLGTDPRISPPPLFTITERDRPLFTVFSQPFTVGSLVAELADGLPGVWSTVTDRQTLEDIARRRALSSVIMAMARRRSFDQNAEIVDKIRRKREEFLVNMMLRELWRDLRPSAEEAREALAAMGQPSPDDDTVVRVQDQLLRSRQAQQLDRYTSELEQRENVRYFLERLPAAMALIESPAPQSAPSRS